MQQRRLVSTNFYVRLLSYQEMLTFVLIFFFTCVAAIRIDVNGNKTTKLFIGWLQSKLSAPEVFVNKHANKAHPSHPHIEKRSFER